MGLAFDSRGSFDVARGGCDTVFSVRSTGRFSADIGVAVNVPLSTDLDDPSAVPYFLWDEPMTVSEFRKRLRTASPEEQARLLGKVLREARDTDVWRFTSPEEVWRRWPEVSRHLGRRKAFWEFLLDRWHKEGLVGS